MKEKAKMKSRQLEIWEVHPHQRLAPRCVGNSAAEEVTNLSKPEGTSFEAVTQVKVLSPEKTIVSEAEAFHLAEGSSRVTDRRRDDATLTGSKSTASKQKDEAGTWETLQASQIEICFSKSGGDKPEQKVCRESDKPIVARKQGNACGAKGLTVAVWEERDTSSTLRGGQRKSTKLSSLSLLARRDKRLKFTSLMHIMDEEFLEECYRELKKERACGIDGVSVEEYGENLKENIKGLVGRLKRKAYRPKPVKRVYIPKGNGGKRPLGIPSVEDKVVQMAMKKILEAIYEEDFLDVSYGFRPGRSCHQALKKVDESVMRKPANYIADMDIEKFFDTVNHRWLMKFLMERIADRNFLRLIGRFLRCGVMEEGKYVEVEEGTPQGGVLSPVLANIYLHYTLDLWFERRFKRESRGYAELVRYADDFVVCFQKIVDAKKFWEEVKDRVGGFGLKISEEKSRILRFGRYPFWGAEERGTKLDTFNFLGFTHYCTKTREGKFKVERRTARDKFRRKIKELNSWLRSVRNTSEVRVWWKILCIKLVGHYSYFGISGNMTALHSFYNLAVWYAFKWLNRRSQRRSMNWKEFYVFLNRNPLPKPRIYHEFYSFANKSCPAEEPCAGNLHARFCEGRLTL